MNKTYIIIAILGIGAYMLFRKSGTTTEADASNNTLGPTAPPGEIKTSALAPTVKFKSSAKRKKIDFKKLKEAVEAGKQAVSGRHNVLN